jgi:hypothetical protein
MRFGQPHIAFFRPPWHTVEQHRVGLALLCRMPRTGAHGACCLAERPGDPESGERSEDRAAGAPLTNNDGEAIEAELIHANLLGRA